MSSQLVNLNLGYGNKAIGDAIKEQVDKFCFVGPSYATEAKSTLAEMIINLLPDSFGKVFFTNAGADANEKRSKDCKNVYGQKQGIQPLQKLSRFFIRRRQPYGRAEKISA